MDNSIRTAKYNLFSFTPLNLYNQFHKVANWYFLLLSLVVCFPSVSPYSKPYATIVPFIFVLLLNMLKDGYVDLQRHKDDKRLNQGICSVLKAKVFTNLPWRDVRVGDILQIDEGEVVPVDMLVLATDLPHSFGGNEDSRQLVGGLCWVDTAELGA